jgi:hypothetical protein
MTYQPKVYRAQGGDSLYVSSGGNIVVEDGGHIHLTGGTLSSTHAHVTIVDSTITLGGYINNDGTLRNRVTIDSTGSILNKGTLTNTGTITNSSDGQIRESVETKVTAGAITPYGVSLIGSSTAGARAYTMVKPPAAGVRKTIIAKGSTGACIVRCSSLCTLNFSANRKITWAANGDGYGIDLIATSATNWQVVRMSTALVTTIVFGTT